MDEDFTTRLRAKVDAVAPAIAVDTTVVVPRARRRRAATRTAALAVVAGIVATGAVWAADGSRPAAPPAGDVREDAPEDLGEDPPDDVAQVEEGWPDAPYWHVAYEELDMTGAATARTDVWYGREAPGVALVDGEPAWAMGPASWGALRLGDAYLDEDDHVLEDGRVLVTWDVLDELPTDRAVLEDILRASVDPAPDSATEDEQVFDLIVDLVRGSPAPPSLRLALWDVATDLEGTEGAQLMQDPRGRLSAFLDRSRTSGQAAGQYYYDPDDGRLLEILLNPTEEQRAAHPDEIVMGWNAVFLEEGPAEETPVEPTLELAGCVSWETC